ncbi:hypothetical protein YC2023_015330 [Brassica napus]
MQQVLLRTVVRTGCSQDVLKAAPSCDRSSHYHFLIIKWWYTVWLKRKNEWLQMSIMDIDLTLESYHTKAERTPSLTHYKPFPTNAESCRKKVDARNKNIVLHCCYSIRAKSKPNVKPTLN